MCCSCVFSPGVSWGAEVVWVRSSATRFSYVSPVETLLVCVVNSVALDTEFADMPFINFDSNTMVRIHFISPRYEVEAFCGARRCDSILCCAKEDAPGAGSAVAWPQGCAVVLPFWFPSRNGPWRTFPCLWVLKCCHFLTLESVSKAECLFVWH